MSRSDPPPLRYFTDRSLGAVVVPRLLREAGFDVETMRDRYGEKRAQDIADVEWLKDVGGAGLVVLMKDKRIRTRPAEQAAVITHAVRCFCIASGSLTGPAMAQLFVDARRRIESLCASPGPFIYSVSRAGVRQVL